MQPIRIFQAADAFAYVDAYRRYSLDQPPAITSAKEKMEEQLARMDVVPSRSWAELRGVEHALRYKLKRQEPGTVVLGPDEGIVDKEGRLLPAGPPPELKELREENERLLGDAEKHKRELKSLHEHQQELEVEIIRHKQDAANLKRKLEQSYGYFVVVGVTGLLALVTLIGILVFRNA